MSIIDLWAVAGAYVVVFTHNKGIFEQGLVLVLKVQ